jgi:hypothetical protein
VKINHVVKRIPKPSLIAILNFRWLRPWFLKVPPPAPPNFNVDDELWGFDFVL